MFFFEKKNQKTFASGCATPLQLRDQKSFASFLQKRSAFLSISGRCARTDMIA
jgi:hypothetical protein